LVNAKNPRQIALRVLQSRSDREYTEALLEQALAPETGAVGVPAGPSAMKSVDRALCQELVYGIVRRQATLDWLIARKTDGRPQNAGLQNLLRLGLYQIFFLDRIPAHAAVHETVELAKRDGYGPKAGFLNAVLRGCLREFDATKRLLADLKVSNPAAGYSHPQWLVEKWQKRFGDESLRQLLDWNNTPPKTFARVSTLKVDAGKLLEAWRMEDVEYDFVRRDFWDASARADMENLVFELKSHPPLAALESFRNGWFYIQDPSTLLACLELAPKPGETILDLCAAPGGKTTFMAQQMNNEGKIVACDISEDRLQLVRENCQRLGVTCVEFLALPLGHAKSNSHPEAVPSPRPSDGRGEGKGEVREIKNSSFDRILIDAPCSNTGVLRRRVDLRWRVSLEEISRLQQAQLELLQLAAPKLKSGGALVYSTCSLEPEENTVVVQEFLRAHPGFKLESERELLPFTDNVDGAFVARFKKL
jgi:16S rRNA (cytosine967-C5)-methyltransferase